MKLIFYFISIW